MRMVGVLRILRTYWSRDDAEAVGGVPGVD